MATSFSLKDEGYSFKKIMSGRKWVGRVVRCGDGRYLGIINAAKGKVEVYAATEADAFRPVEVIWRENSTQDDLAKWRAARERKIFGDYSFADDPRAHRDHGTAPVLPPPTHVPAGSSIA